MTLKTSPSPAAKYYRIIVDSTDDLAGSSLYGEYRKLLNGLSYKQLLRINAAVTADTEGEKIASRQFFRSLTPPENKVVKSIENERDMHVRKWKIDYLNHSLQQKNKAEIDGVDILDLLRSASLIHDL